MSVMTSSSLQAIMLNMDTLQTESTPEEHQYVITDVRFRPISTRFVTASFDQTVRIWDAADVKYILVTGQICFISTGYVLVFIAELERNVQALQAKHLSSTGERFKVVFVDGIILTKAGTMIGGTSNGMEMLGINLLVT
ncbi:transcriptional coregulator [Tanacetum coccineum]